MAWQDTLQPASWRGVPFGWDAAEGSAGRTTAPHGYPFRDTTPAWVEDTGIAPRTHRIVGYLVGDDYVAQLEDMLDAAEVRGQGELVHPMLGSRIGTLVAPLRYAARKDRGRVVELVFDFLEGDADPLYPAAGSDTQGAVKSAASDAKASAAKDYAKNTGTQDAGTTLQTGLA